jgi:hypothetical protein
MRVFTSRERSPINKNLGFDVTLDLNLIGIGLQRLRGVTSY